MLEIPEAAVITQQLNSTVAGKVIRRVIAAQNPHGFAWYSGDPAGYPDLLVGKTVGRAVNHCGMVEIPVEDVLLLFTDGINLRFHQSSAEQPPKHQLLVEFEDGSALSATVAMYGGLWCFLPGTNDNPYYLAATEKPSPLADGFTRDHFLSLFSAEAVKLSLKAFLATQQRIPGLGNGVLQDILYEARLHPKRKVVTLNEAEKSALFAAIKTTLCEMAEKGGRDTERDLFGCPGGYQTRLSKNTAGQPCSRCGSLIQKQSYLGGSIYFCPGCQAEG